jgi:hypothetical protein
MDPYYYIPALFVVLISVTIGYLSQIFDHITGTRAYSTYFVARITQRYPLRLALSLRRDVEWSALLEPVGP